jgi:TPR repeat protein
MRVLLKSLILLLLATTVQAQQGSIPKCELQQLAIDAALGDTAALYNLGVEFFRGTNLPRDYAKAANLWRRASEAGSVEASNNLGFLRYYGRPGVERDYGEGIRLWRFAAERGFAESQVHMGQAYSDGRFLKSDFIEAYAWAKAGKHHSSRMTDTIDNPQISDEVAKDAEKVLADMRKRLSAVEMVSAEKKAADYIRRFAPQ